MYVFAQDLHGPGGEKQRTVTNKDNVIKIDINLLRSGPVLRCDMDDDVTPERSLFNVRGVRQVVGKHNPQFCSNSTVEALLVQIQKGF